ncbi:MAG: hypothetical protein HY735_23580 [Verrucomicrobia bacterium]|nr:hypothetical protein [Verrucomicrobiota bacterium]
MSGIITSECEKFLQAFLSSARTLDGKTFPDDFMLRFVQYADSFTVGCCDRFSAFLREASITAEIRGTSEGVLSRLVRNRCFEATDVLLADYVDLLKQGGINVGQLVPQLSDSRVRDLVSQSSQVSAAVNGEGRKNLSVPQVARGLALLKILDFFTAFNSLIHEFLDYGGSKLFGGDVDFMMQERFLSTIRDSIHEKLTNAIAIVEGFELVKQRKWEHQRAAESATIKAVTMMASQAQVKRKSGISSLVIAVVCGAPIWFLFNLGIMNRYVIGLIAALSLAAVFFLFRGIIHLTKG